MTRRAARRDHNHRAVADTFRDLGCSVFETDRVGEGFPDIVVGLMGRSLLVEIKNPQTHYGRGGLNFAESAFAASWRGSPVTVITSEIEAEAFVQNIRKGAAHAD